MKLSASPALPAPRQATHQQLMAGVPTKHDSKMVKVVCDETQGIVAYDVASPTAHQSGHALGKALAQNLVGL